MTDYIERAAVEHMLEAAQVVSDADGIYCGYCTEDVRLSEIPSVDVAPVRHGRWLLRHVGHGHYWECSVCHKNPCIYVTKDTNYCPNCGAKMEE